MVKTCQGLSDPSDPDKSKWESVLADVRSKSKSELSVYFRRGLKMVLDREYEPAAADRIIERTLLQVMEIIQQDTTLVGSALPALVQRTMRSIAPSRRGIKLFPADQAVPPVFQS